MADDRQTTPRDEDDHFGYGQQPLRRTDETTGDEGLAPPTGDGPDEATIGRSQPPPDQGDDVDDDRD